MKRYDSAEIVGKIEKTPEGYIKAKAVVTRAGTFKYRDKDGSVRVELRKDEEVFRDATLESLKMIPVTLGHPKEFVTAKNAKQLAKGFTGETVERRGDECIVSLLITHEDAIKAVENGQRELSLGYDLEIDPTPGTYKGERYDQEQTEIVYNHLAIVNSARAGSRACLRFDADDAVLVLDGEQQGGTMKIEINGVMTEVDDAFGSAYLAQAKRADEAEAKATAVQTAADVAQAAADEAKAEADAAKATRVDEAEIEKRVNARVRLATIAARAMDAADVAKLEGKTDREKMIAIIAKRHDGFTGEGKSDDYLAARIDLIEESLGAPSASNPAPNQHQQFRKDADDTRVDENDMEAAYKRQFSAYNNKTDKK